MDETQPENKTVSLWWESKLFLLVAGFILTGILGPWLQYVQKRLEWKNQISFDAYSKRMKIMQDGRAQLLQTYIGYSELLDKLDNSISGSVENSNLVSLSKEITANDSMRVKAYADISLHLEDFSDAETIRLPVEQLMQAWKATIDAGRAISRGKGSAVERDEFRKTFDRAKEQFRIQYRQAKIEMERQIGQFEDTNKKLFF